MSDIETLRAEHVRLTEILRQVESIGTPAYRKVTLAHRLVTDLLAHGGGSMNERAYVAEKMKQIEDGTHPDLLPG